MPQVNDAIYFYSRGEEQWRFLSNFYRAPFAYNKQWWPTAEHLYQALKFKDEGMMNHIRLLQFPQDAKQYARKAMIESKVNEQYWESKSLHLMRMIITLKFSQHTDLLKQLVQTGERELVHQCNWEEHSFWGVGRSGGENHLGKILMEARSQMKDWIYR